MALKRRMMKKTLLRWHRLRRTVFAPRGTVSTIARELAQEQWQLYPQDERQLLPDTTRQRSQVARDICYDQVRA